MGLAIELADEAGEMTWMDGRKTWRQGIVKMRLAAYVSEGKGGKEKSAQAWPLSEVAMNKINGIGYRRMGAKPGAE